VVSDGTGQENEAGENEADAHDSHGGSEAEAACEQGADRQVRTLNGTRRVGHVVEARRARRHEVAPASGKMR
jgi:hypothetical protein